MSHQSRHWCFTKQSDDQTSLEWCLSDESNLPLYNPDENKVQCLYYQVEEAPKTHKIHLQGFIIFKRKTVFNKVRSLFPGCHIELSKGSQEQNIAYCSKSETKVKGPFQIGELDHPRVSKPLHECVDMIKSGKSLRDVAEANPSVYVKHYRGLDALQKVLTSKSPSWRQLEVTWIWGLTGLGKTRQVFEKYPDLYEVHDDGTWWDGYLNQDVILFDEFYGDIKVKKMLRWLDGYPIHLPVKGSFVNAHWTKVYITSDTSPQDVYKNVPQAVRDAFFRRITSVVHIE